MQKKGLLAQLLDEVISERNELINHPPLLVKIAPDLTEEEKRDIADVLKDMQVNGRFSCCFHDLAFLNSSAECVSLRVKWMD